MKRSLSKFIIVGSVSTAMEVDLFPFTDWNDLTKKSPDIVIARCTATQAPLTPGDGMIWSDVEVVSVLKGNAKPGAGRMVSLYWPYQGQQFLIFSENESHQWEQANRVTKTYRIVRLRRDFPTSGLVRKPLDNQIELICKSGLDDLDQDVKRLRDCA